MEKRLIVASAVMLLAFSQAVAGAAELKSTRWEKEIAAFEASDRTNPPPKGAILFVGSSSIRYWTNLAADFPELKVINRGYGARTTPYVIIAIIHHYFRRLIRKDNTVSEIGRVCHVRTAETAIDHF